MPAATRKQRLLSAALAATVAFGAVGGVALAAGRGQNGNRGERESAAEVAAVLAARTTAADAVAAAERSAGGGRAVKVALEDENGAHLYEVRVVAPGGDRVVTVKVDPATGTVRGTEARGALARLFDGEDRGEIGALLRANTTLVAAIASAERLVGDGGRAVEAAWEGEDAALGYEVEVAHNGAITKVFVDAPTGTARLAAPDRR